MDTSLHSYIGKSADRYIRPFFALALLLMVTVAMLLEGIYDTGDGILHYQISRWSWKHPELFLHHWGKPVFTLIASPFAQFGYKGVVLFNVLCHIGTAWLTWRIADRMKIPFAFLAGPLLIFAPVSWGVAQSGLTEPLFALTLMLGIYFVTAGRNVTAALVISLLPFVRTEGFLLAPLFGLFFLARREYLSIVLLLSGTLLYSLIGSIFVHDDFLWVFHLNPYRGEEQYGHGELLHFVGNNEFLFGWAMTGLIAIGLLTFPFRRKMTPRHSLAEVLLVCGCFLVFFTAHSVFWWKGWVGSLGLLRVMACITPCAVILSLRGLQALSILLRYMRPVVLSLTILATGLTVFNTMNYHGILLQPDEQQVKAEQLATFIKENGLQSRIIYSAHPIVSHVLDKDPFDNNSMRELGSLYTYDPTPGSLLIQDPQFTPFLLAENKTLEETFNITCDTVYTIASEDPTKLNWKILLVK